jgi:hypothetical protein
MSPPDNHEGSLTPLADDRAWARGVLGVADGATSEHTRAAMLSRLEEAAFVPPPQWEKAILLLVDDPPDELWARLGGKVVPAEREALLKREVDHFTDNFFGLSLTERHNRWCELTEKCAGIVTLTTRLEALVDGLDLDVSGPESSPPDNILARELCRTFVLPPSQRVMAHKDIQLRAESNPRKWQSAAEEINVRYAQFKELGPLLIAGFTDYVRKQETAVKEKKKQKAIAARVARDTDVDPPWWDFIFNPKRRWDLLISGPDNPTARRWYWLIVVVVNILGVSLFLMRIFFPHDKLPPQPNPYQPRIISPYQAPSLDTLGDQWQKARQGGIMPPRTSATFPGKPLDEGKFEVDDEYRRNLGIPDDVDIFIENGQFAFRRKPANY